MRGLNIRKIRQKLLNLLLKINRGPFYENPEPGPESGIKIPEQSGIRNPLNLNPVPPYDLHLLSLHLKTLILPKLGL